MKKIAVVLCLCMILSSLTAFAGGVWERINVDINDVNINVNGTEVYARNFVHEGTTYLSLRDMGTVLGFDVSWDAETNTAILTSGNTAEYNFMKGEKSTQSIAVLVNDVNVVVNGVLIDARNFVYEDTTYLSLRDIGSATGYDVYWDEVTYTAMLVSASEGGAGGVEVDPKEIFTATVNGIEIPYVYLSDCYSYAASMGADETAIIAFLEEQAIYYAYVMSECEKYNITLSEEENTFTEDFLEMVELNGGKEAVELILAEMGTTYDEYEKAFYDIMTMNALSTKLSLYLEENDETIKKALEEAQALYEAQKGSNSTDAVIVKHILIPFEEGKSKESVKAEANNILNKLNSGQRFEVLLEKNNNDPGQPDEGYVVYKDSGFVAEFEEAALNLKKGQTSGLVESVYGYHIIKAIDTQKLEATFDEFVGSNQDVYTKLSEAYAKPMVTWAENAEKTFGWEAK